MIVLSRKGKVYYSQPVWRRMMFWGMVLALLTGLFGIGFYSGLYSFSERQYVRSWKQQIARQQLYIGRLERRAEADIDALTKRLGQMQSHVVRIDALGAKLVTMAKLDNEEFAFSSEPALGGPEILHDANGYRWSLDDAFDQLEQYFSQRERTLQVLDKMLHFRNLEATIHPSGRPIKKGWISSSYGLRTSPFTGRPQFHRGIDFASRMGEDIYAVASGVVVSSRLRGSFGNMIEINHGNGYATRYAHNESNLVKEGDIVKRGQIIGKVGSTGNSTGPHVHFEVLSNGARINPREFIGYRQ